MKAWANHGIHCSKTRAPAVWPTPRTEHILPYGCMTGSLLESRQESTPATAVQVPQRHPNCASHSKTKLENRGTQSVHHTARLYSKTCATGRINTPFKFNCCSSCCRRLYVESSIYHYQERHSGAGAQMQCYDTSYQT